MASSRIALRYSKSLLDLATEGNKVEEVKNDMDTVRNICSESLELSSLLNNPIVKSEAKKTVMNKVFSDTNEITRNFISFLVDKKRESELPMVADYYISYYNDMKGITKATIVSAVFLSDETLKQMKSYVVGLLGKEDIELVNEIDPKIVGGVIIKHEDKLLDKSVSRELREIRKQLIYN